MRSSCCLFVCVPLMFTFECLNKSLRNFVYIFWNVDPLLGNDRETERKREVRLWKPLPRTASEDLTVDMVCVCVFNTEF
jgi:hypothetical protein